MAQGQIATVTCGVLGCRCAFLTALVSLNGSLKAASRYKPIAIAPEGLIVRYHCFSVNNPCSRFGAKDQEELGGNQWAKE
jgi:hypothetical protein